jgi:hypothetical protein
MKAKNINRVNEAVYILRHFIDLSAQLLPFLIELQYTKKPTETDLEDKEKIIDVYQNYNFDKETSKMLMNSSILETIQNSFEFIVSKSSSKDKSKKHLLEFRKEHRRLQKSWQLIDSN